MFSFAFFSVYRKLFSDYPSYYVFKLSKNSQYISGKAISLEFINLKKFKILCVSLNILIINIGISMKTHTDSSLRFVEKKMATVR